MDAFGVAFASGVTLKTKATYRQTFRLSWHFGLFQALMPIAGWSAGLTVKHLIEKVDHWVAFLLLFFIGLRMMIGSIKSTKNPTHEKDPTKGGTLIMLSIATSIDALAAGLSLSILEIAIWKPAMIIGIVATTFTMIGFHLGQLVGAHSRLGNWAEALGGILLLGIGLTILHEHGVF